ncbi:MAG: hypothetical protein HYX43_10570 [Burkholderiales bacterium]|nr:hypothetical protein [Burkholderiales bacterium]
MSKDLLETLNTQRVELEAKLTEEQAVRDDFALRVATQSTDENNTGLDEAEKEIARIQKELGRNAAARRAAEAQATDEGRAASEAEAAALAQQVIDLAAQCEQMAPKIDAAARVFGKELSAYAEKARGFRALFRGLLDRKATLTDAQRDAITEQAANLSRGGAASVALLHALKANGIGSSDSIYNDELASISRRESELTFADAAALAADRAAGLVAKLQA